MFLLIKQCRHVYSCYLCTNFFVLFFFFFCVFVCLFICFFLVENFYVYFLEFNNCVCKFDKDKNKNLLKKKKKKKETSTLDKGIKNYCIAPSPNAWVNFETKILGTFFFCCVILYGTRMNVKLKIL